MKITPKNMKCWRFLCFLFGKKMGDLFCYSSHFSDYYGNFNHFRTSQAGCSCGCGISV